MTASEHRVRRVVMGEPAPGRSEFTRVEEIPPQSFGESTAIWPIWGWDAPQAVPNDGSEGRAPDYFTEMYTPGAYMPPSGGLSIGATRFAPGEWGAMHQSTSTDIAVVVSGRVTVADTEGNEVELGPGDVYIQHGALHAWRGDPDDPAHVVFINVGAESATS